MKRVSSKLDFIEDNDQSLMVYSEKYQLSKEMLDNVIWSMIKLNIKHKATYKNGIPHIVFTEPISNGVRKHDFYTKNGVHFSNVKRIITL